MNSMTVGKEKLINVLKNNRKKHRDLFLKAQHEYRKQVIQELDDMIEAAKRGDNIRRHVNLRAPEDHTVDYDRLIGLLEMSHEENVALTQVEYNSYVLDDWNWSRAANFVHETYSSGNFVAENAQLGKSY